MNQTIDTILNRCSVRSFDPNPIPRETLDQIIQCGSAGPSGANNRAWRYVVVTDPKLRKKLITQSIPLYKKWLEGMPAKFKEMRVEIDTTADPIYYGAPTIIFVIGKGFTADMDCPIACQNMMLAARSPGIGSCWVHIGQLVIGDPEARLSLEIGEGEKVFGPIILGYPKGGFPGPKEKSPLPVKWF
jgi:nitroreductase